MADDPTWFRDLFPAKFAGVPFKVLRHTREGGIRGPDHEYPERDEGSPEDTGNKLDRWNFEAFTIGDDHHRQAVELIEAFRAGRGELVHPRWGRQIAICRTWEHSEGVAEQGWSRFNLRFIDASRELGVALLIAGEAAVAESGANVKAAANAGFLETFQIENLSAPSRRTRFWISPDICSRCWWVSE